MAGKVKGLDNIIPFPSVPYFSARYGSAAKKKKQKAKKKKAAPVLPAILQPIPAKASSSFMDELLPIINSHNEILTQKKLDSLQEENGQEKEDQKNCSCSGSTSTLELPLPKSRDESTYDSTASEDSKCSVCACPEIIRSRTGLIPLTFLEGSQITTHLLLSLAGNRAIVQDHTFSDPDMLEQSLFITEHGTIDGTHLSISFSRAPLDPEPTDLSSEIKLHFQWYSFVGQGQLTFAKKGDGETHSFRVPALPDTWENTTKSDLFRPLTVDKFEQLALQVELASTIGPLTVQLHLSLVFSINAGL